VVGVSLPPDGAEPDEAVLKTLHPDERHVALSHRGFRRASFVGGRLAAHGAIQGLGGPFTGIDTGPRGAPIAPAGVSLSITHKKDLAIAIAARSDLGVLGVDLENLDPERPDIAPRILRPDEQERIEQLPPDRRWIAIVLRFSIKEAIYKALAPKLQRYIGFDEASVALHTDGQARVALHLNSGPTPEQIDARFAWLDRAVLSTVQVRW
jgi:4'-phosphopantetheinyl transferase EntD